MQFYPVTVYKQKGNIISNAHLSNKRCVSIIRVHPSTCETSNIKWKLNLQLTIEEGASIKGDPRDMFAEIHFKSALYSYKELLCYIESQCHVELKLRFNKKQNRIQALWNKTISEIRLTHCESTFLLITDWHSGN